MHGGCRGGGGWRGLGIQSGAWGGLGVWVRGGFHQAIVLVDLALGLRTRVGLVGWGVGEGGVAQRLWVSSRSLHCGKEGTGDYDRCF
jgi:hypothetical protein